MGLTIALFSLLVEETKQTKVSKGAKIKNRYNQVPHLGSGYQWKSNKLTVGHHKREPRGQLFPAGDHNAHINRRTKN